jgi:hypothetical protein
MAAAWKGAAARAMEAGGTGGGDGEGEIEVAADMKYGNDRPP